MYTNACSLGNRQEELELHVKSPKSIIGITERSWENLHGLMAEVGGCKLMVKLFAFPRNSSNLKQGSQVL